MNNQNAIQNEHQIKLPQDEGGNDLIVIWSLFKKNWYFFLIALSLGFLCARFYVGHTLPVYRTTATILIQETDERRLVDNSELLQGLGLPGGMRNLENQIMILKSRALTESTLKELPYDVNYYFKTFKNKISIYPVAPFRIFSENGISLPTDTEFSISYMGKNSYLLESKSENFPIRKVSQFGDTIDIRGGIYKIECSDPEWFNTHSDSKHFFVINSIKRLVNHYNKRLNVELVSRGGSVLRISMNGTNPTQDCDFLNKHLEKFQNISLDKKNNEADRRIQFIENQLIGISDSLSITETKLQQFRSSHRVMDLSAQGQAIIGQVTLLENEKARLELEASYYDYLADYLTKDLTGELPIVPITMGISDPGLTRLVDELATLQDQVTTTGAGQLNPLQRNLQQRVLTTKASLRETLNGLRRANSLARSENQTQINRANSQASSLPVTERQLLGIERKFKLNDELNTFLLETQAEQQMQKASNKADSEVIDSADARYSAIIAPNPPKTYLIGILAALVITSLIIYIRIMFDKKLKDEDIKKMTNLPVVGSIPRSLEKTNAVVFANPDSIIAEAFRLLRSRMQFFTKDAKSPVILITSSTPGEGKTFTAINLASVYSLLDRKTVLVGFDLRKPKIIQDFNLTNDKGVSTWLIGQDKLLDIIQKSPYNNLSVITSGPIPPNPSELISLEKTGELFKSLKEMFDYIIVDSPPIGIVSDTYHLASMADALVMVVRPGHTLRDMFGMTLSEINSSELKGISLIINDITTDSKNYGYGGKYGYTSGKPKKKRFFKRRGMK